MHMKKGVFLRVNQSARTQTTYCSARPGCVSQAQVCIPVCNGADRTDKSATAADRCFCLHWMIIDLIFQRQHDWMNAQVITQGFNLVRKTRRWLFQFNRSIIRV